MTLRRPLILLALTLAVVLGSVPAADASRINVASDPAGTSWGAGRMDLLVRGSDNALWHLAFNNAWAPWQSLAGDIRGKPSVVSWEPGTLGVFVRGADDKLWHRHFSAGSWGRWQKLGDVQFDGNPEAVSWGRGHYDVFVRAKSGEQWHTWYSAQCGGWCGWENQSGILYSDPETISWEPGHLDVFHRGSDSRLYHRWFGAYGWSGYAQLGTHQFYGKPNAVSWGWGHIDVFARGLDHSLIHHPYMYWPCQNWCGWGTQGGLLTSDDPAPVSWGPEHMAVYVQGTNRALYDKWFQSAYGGWGQWWRVTDEWQMADANTQVEPISMKSGHIDVFWRHPDGTLRHRWYEGGWSSDPQTSLGRPSESDDRMRFGLSQPTNPGTVPGWNFYNDPSFTKLSPRDGTASRDGADAVRIHVKYNASFTPTEINRVDNLVNGATDRGAEILMTITHDGNEPDPPMPHVYREHVGALVARWGAKVRYWGPANEPNAGDMWLRPGESGPNDPKALVHGMTAVQLLKSYYDTMVSLVGAGRVTGPDFVHPLVTMAGEQYSVADWVREYRAVGGGFGVAAALHPYGPVENRDLGPVQAYRNALPAGTRIWFTEVGAVRFRRAMAPNSDTVVYQIPADGQQRNELDVADRLVWLTGTLMQRVSGIDRLYYYQLHAHNQVPSARDAAGNRMSVFDTGLLIPDDSRARSFTWSAYCRITRPDPTGCY